MHLHILNKWILDTCSHTYAGLAGSKHTSCYYHEEKKKAQATKADLVN